MNIAFAGVAIAFLAAFLGILLWHVPRVDLVAVVAVTLALVVFDLASGRK